jgi:hypothetical protein
MFRKKKVQKHKIRQNLMHIIKINLSFHKINLFYEINYVYTFVKSKKTLIIF